MLIRLLYTAGIGMYTLGVRTAALTSEKPRQMCQGWKEAWTKVRPEGRVAWFHAASLGEFEQARPVLEELRKRHPEYKVWLTFFSPSGYEVRKNYAGADVVTYLPMDTMSNARRLVELINPDVAFFVKYEFWYNYMEELNKRGVPTYLFSAIFRKSQYFFQPYGFWFRDKLRTFNHIFVQNDESLQILKHHYLASCSKTGDTRFDRVAQIAAHATEVPEVAQFAEGGQCLVAGSTWEPDEERLKHYGDHCGWRVKMVLAPHMIDEGHLEHIEQLMGRERCVRYSAAKAGADTSKARVMIIDNIGMLSSLYRYGQVAYVGGGFGKGIHNILEAVTYGMPVVFGPKHHKFQEALDIIERWGGASYVSAEELERVLDTWFGDERLRLRAGKRCTEYVKENLGCTEKILAEVEEML